MVVGHLHAVVGKSAPQVFVDGEVNRPVVLNRAPAENGVLNGAGAVIGQLHGGSGIAENAGGGGHSLQAGGLHILGRRVVGRRHGADHPAAAQDRVVDDLGGGEVLVGHQDHLAVRGLQLGVVQADLADGAGNAAGLDEVAHGKGPGGENHQPAGHIAQNVLRRQSDAQGEDGQQGRQGGGVEAQGLGGDDDRQDIEQGLYGGENQLLQTVIDLLHPVYQPGGDLHNEPDRNQADQQRHQGGENFSKAVAAHGGAQHGRKISLHWNPLTVRPCGRPR